MSNFILAISDNVQNNRGVSIGIAVAAGFALLRIIQRIRWGRCPRNLNMSGKTAIVTGANSGIGRETALDLAKRDARVILACRNPSLAQEAVSYIRKNTSQGELIVKTIDLQSFASVREFVKEFKSMNKGLDVLINNAGVYGCPFALTAEGYETQFAVNHLGHFLLTNLLLDELKKSKSGRIVILSSAYYSRGVIDFEDLNGSKNYKGKQAYCNSKLANMMFGIELNKRLKGEVNVYMVSPGIVWTNLGRHTIIPLWKKVLLAPIAFLLVRTASEGSQTVLYCAASDDVKNESGFYYRNCKQCQMNYDVLDADAAKRLWDVSSSLTKLI